MVCSKAAGMLGQSHVTGNAMWLFFGFKVLFPGAGAAEFHAAHFGPDIEGYGSEWRSQYESVANSAAQECGNIAGALSHRNDLRGVAFGAVNDEVRADGPEQNREPRKVFAPVPHAGSAPEGFKRIEQFADPSVGGVDTVRSNVLPDIVQIEARIYAEDVAAHATGFRRSADLR
jgi:hypothetical protein